MPLDLVGAAAAVGSGPRLARKRPEGPVHIREVEIESLALRVKESPRPGRPRRLVCCGMRSAKQYDSCESRPSLPARADTGEAVDVSPGRAKAVARAGRKKHRHC